MSRRSCPHCYKTTDDEEHSWFCIYGSGIQPNKPKVKKPDDDDHRPPGGGGGGDGGEPRIIPPPWTPRPGGAAVRLPPEQKTINMGALDRAHPLLEHKQQLALPAPKVRDHGDHTSAQSGSRTVGKPQSSIGHRPQGR
jgi:hypothetical protein